MRGGTGKKRRWLDFLWPRMGLVRYMSYLRHRLGRMQGSSHSIAAGFAAGAAVSMMPIMGFHFVAAAVLAFLTRGSLIVSAIGTVVGNPWTFPFIWLWTYKIGVWMMGGSPEEGPFRNFSFSAALHDPITALKPIWLPMFVGSIPTAIVTWFLFYWPLKGLLESYRRQRIERRHMRAVRLMEERRALEQGKEPA